ncbi:YMGG-like Gly-zipper [Phyllobacterium sp. CL33Tsu]|nr:YMGG-like Gly-zipper [Phyllobacterium sp. CL33Tsu]
MFPFKTESLTMNLVPDNRVQQNQYSMPKFVLTVALIMGLAGCTTTEKDLSVGTAAGAIIGGIADGGKGALIGAGVGALGGLLVRNLRNGYCQYRDRNGRIYTARCR